MVFTPSVAPRSNDDLRRWRRRVDDELRLLRSSRGLLERGSVGGVTIREVVTAEPPVLEFIDHDRSIYAGGDTYIALTKVPINGSLILFWGNLVLPPDAWSTVSGQVIYVMDQAVFQDGDEFRVQYAVDNATPYASFPVLPAHAMPEAVEQDTYSDVIPLENGGDSGTWILVSGELPPGLDLNADTGEIFGTPDLLAPEYSPSSDYAFKIRYVDNITGNFAENTYTLRVNMATVPMGANADPFSQYIAGSPSVSISKNVGGKLVVLVEQTSPARPVAASRDTEVVFADIRSQSPISFDPIYKRNGQTAWVIGSWDGTTFTVKQITGIWGSDNNNQGTIYYPMFAPMPVEAGDVMGIWSGTDDGASGDTYLAYTDDLEGTSVIADAPTKPVPGDTFTMTVDPDGVFLARMGRRNPGD